MTPRRSGTGRTSRGRASITTRPPARPARPTSTATSSSCWPCSWPTRRGESSPCRCWRGSTSARRTCRASTRSIGRRSAPSWSWPSSCSGGPSRGWTLLNLPIWVVADGAYANAAFLKPAMALGMTVVSRLRKDAALRTLPGPRPAGKRGRPRTYGEDVIDLAKRGGQRRGWSSDTFELYGEEVVKKYKTFLATWRPAGGAIRVVLVDEPTGWRAYFCTDTEASVADILGMVADRFSLEITFRECKQVVGAGPAAGEVHLGEHRGVPRLPVDLHDDRGVGLGPEGWRSWWTARRRRGTRRHAGRATRTSGGRGGVNCWARRFVRFYARGLPRRKFRPQPKGCSAWPRNVYIFPESAVTFPTDSLTRLPRPPARVRILL